MKPMYGVVIRDLKICTADILKLNMPLHQKNLELLADKSTAVLSNVIELLI